MTSAKSTLADAREALKAHEAMITELEREIARGDAEQTPTRAEEVVMQLVKLLAEEPDQAAWSFKARLLLKEAVEAPAEADTSEDDDLDGDMSEDMAETGDGSDAGAPLKRKPDRGGYGKGHKLRRGCTGRGAGWRGRTVSPEHRGQGSGDGEGEGRTAVDGDGSVTLTRQ